MSDHPPDAEVREWLSWFEAILGYALKGPENMPGPELYKVSKKAARLAHALLAARERITSVEEALQPRCCHVTGTHNPTHFERDPTKFCEIQEAKAWQQAVKALSLSFEKAIPKSNCSWCKRKGLLDAD